MPACPLHGLPSTVGASALQSLPLPHKPGTEEGSREWGAVGMAWSYVTGGLGAGPLLPVALQGWRLWPAPSFLRQRTAHLSKGLRCHGRPCRLLLS